jgi:hypothetical protein
MADNIVEIFLLRSMILCVLENETGNYSVLDFVLLCLLCYIVGIKIRNILEAFMGNVEPTLPSLPFSS